MSDAFDRGRDTEREVAAVLRKKLGARVQRDSRSGAGVHKADIRDYYQELPIFIECKDQETIKVKEWMRQTIDGASFNQVPTLVFRMDTALMACVPFPDLVNLLVEIADLRAEVDDLRQPVHSSGVTQPPTISMHSQAKKLSKKTETALIEVGKAVTKQVERGAKVCKNGHIVDDYGYCLQTGCKYSRGYRSPKGKK